MSNNPFSSVVEDVQQTPKTNKPAVAINGIAKQMQQSQNEQTKQLGQQLQQCQTELVNALQQS